MISEKKAAEAIEKADDVGLYGADWFSRVGVADVSVASNGCGPEWMSSEWRDRLTDWLAIFFPAFCIHDCRFTYHNNGQRARFNHANNELEKNCLLLADAEYGWYNPMRYVWRHRAKIVAECCRDFGWSAWRDAYAVSKSTKGK